MFDRVVSLASLMVVVALCVLFLMGTWLAMTGQTSGVDRLLALFGWLAAAHILHRYAGSNWLDPVSIVKKR